MGEQDARIRHGADGHARRSLVSAPQDESILLDLLDEAAGAATGPRLRPRRAAALIVRDDSHDPPRVLMGRRNPKLAFMGDRFVFPGGRVDAADRRMTALSDLPAATAARLAARRPGAGRALALAAIRETFEETGYLIGAPADAPARAPRGVWSAFAAHGVLPKLDGLRLAARAITPPGRVRRFDTAFFCVDAGQIAGRTSRSFGAEDELVEIAWIALSEVERYPLPAITRVVLRELAARAADAPPPFYRQIRGRWRREEL